MSSEKKRAIVFLGMVYPYGIVRHFAQQAAEVNKLAEGGGVDFFFASMKRRNDASNADAWGIIAGSFNGDRIIVKPTFQEEIFAIAELFDRYDRVLLHYEGGLSQTRYILPFKKQFGDRLILMATTQYFQNNSWKRVPVSMLQCWLYLRYVRMVNFQTPFAARKFVGHSLLFKRGKATIIPMACTTQVDDDNEVPELVERMNLADLLQDERKFKFVYLAGFRPGKNHMWLIESMASILKEHPHVHLLLFGRGGSIRDDVIARARGLGLSSQVLAPGALPHQNVLWVLRHCNCAIVPSVSETFGHAYIEPMMAGLPILGTRVGAGEYVVRDYQTGFAFDLHSPATLQAAVRALIDDQEETKRMGSNARAMAERMFSFEGVARAHYLLYKHLLFENG